MERIRRIQVSLRLPGNLILMALLISGSPVPAPAQTKPHAEKSFAQMLVETTRAKHPELEEVGISAVTSRGCVGIASTDKTDIGGRCEKEDSEPMRTGKPVVEKDKDGFDVTLPLHDSAGKMIGSAGFGFKPAPGQTEASVSEQARKVAAEMEAQIPSKAKLLERPD